MLNYAQINSPSLNVRKAPSLSAARYNAPWPINRIALVSPSTPDWYETTYRGQQAFISSKYVSLLPDPVPPFIPDRFEFIATHELGCTNSIYFNGYGGKWCHRFADWLVMHAGMPKERVPDVGGCGWGIVWFVRNNRFYFKGEDHKRRMIRGYPEIRGFTPPALTSDEEAYQPVTGDYIYFRWSSADPSVNVSHVGIVRRVDEVALSTFEGNVGKRSSAGNSSWMIAASSVMGILIIRWSHNNSRLQSQQLGLWAFLFCPSPFFVKKCNKTNL